MDCNAGGPDAGSKGNLLGAAIRELDNDGPAPHLLNFAVHHGLDTRPAQHGILSDPGTCFGTGILQAAPCSK